MILDYIKENANTVLHKNGDNHYFYDAYLNGIQFFENADEEDIKRIVGMCNLEEGDLLNYINTETMVLLTVNLDFKEYVIIGFTGYG